MPKSLGGILCSQESCGKEAVALLLLVCDGDGRCEEHTHGIPSCAVHLLTLAQFVERRFDHGLHRALELPLGPIGGIPG